MLQLDNCFSSNGGVDFSDEFQEYFQIVIHVISVRNVFDSYLYVLLLRLMCLELSFW